MNISSSGWRQFCSSYINSYISNTIFDGVYLDDVWNQLSSFISWGQITNLSAIPNNTIFNWHSDMTGLLQHITGSIIEGHKVIINTNEYMTNDFLSFVDGKMDEGFAHPPWLNLNDFQNSSFNPINHINAMARDSATNKIFLCMNGAVLPNNLNITDVIDNINYCYVAALLAINGSNCYFGYNVGSEFTYNFNSGTLFSPPTANLGLPSCQYYQSQSIYMRDFALGKVLFNPSDKAYNVDLGGNYRLMDGTEVSSIIVGSRAGIILFVK